MTDIDFAHYWASVRSEVDAGLAQWIPEFFRDCRDDQRAAIHRTLARGKRLRGCLVCLTCEALGGLRTDAIPRAVAIECIQAASLIHDDFVDDDAVRRARPATWTVEGARRAVLLGDVMFATAIERMASLSARDSAVIARTIATLARGAYQELLDPTELTRAVAQGRLSADSYPTLIYLKTGALFGAAAELGAIAAQADDDTQARAFTFGARVGEAYQIADDLCDLFSGPHRSTPAQILPALHFAGDSTRHADESARLLATLANTDSDEWQERVAQVRERMRREITRRLDRAAVAIVQFPDGPYRRLLETLPAAVVSEMPPGDAAARAACAH